MKKLCTLSQLPDPGCMEFNVEMQGQAVSIFVVRLSSLVVAYVNRCPHKLLSLNWQPDSFLDDQYEYIVCANHHAVFRVADGVCIQGPCVGARLSATKIFVNQGGVYLGD